MRLARIGSKSCANRARPMAEYVRRIAHDWRDDAGPSNLTCGGSCRRHRRRSTSCLDAAKPAGKDGTEPHCTARCALPGPGSQMARRARGAPGLATGSVRLPDRGFDPRADPIGPPGPQLRTLPSTPALSDSPASWRSSVQVAAASFSELTRIVGTGQLVRSWPSAPIVVAKTRKTHRELLGDLDSHEAAQEGRRKSTPGSTRTASRRRPRAAECGSARPMSTTGGCSTCTVVGSNPRAVTTSTIRRATRPLFQN